MLAMDANCSMENVGDVCEGGEAIADNWSMEDVGYKGGGDMENDGDLSGAGEAMEENWSMDYDGRKGGEGWVQEKTEKNEIEMKMSAGVIGEPSWEVHRTVTKSGATQDEVSNTTAKW